MGPRRAADPDRRQAGSPGLVEDGLMDLVSKVRLESCGQSFAGHQPSIGETYISTGSLYLCSEAFIMLGLPAGDPFWQGKDEPWTAKKMWAGEDMPVDHAYQEKAK